MQIVDHYRQVAAVESRLSLQSRHFFCWTVRNYLLVLVRSRRRQRRPVGVVRSSGEKQSQQV